MRVNESRKDPLFMNPAIFIGTAVCLGFLFALQEWVFSRRMGSHWGATIFFEVWGLHFFLWGTICWLLWRLLRDAVQRASVAVMLLFFRGIGYFERYRENERTAAQLEVQLANARLSALRMQLNPHFLFNTMNSISGLMRTDVDSADEMLEQLSSLLRISLERGQVQLIPLHDEIEFIEVYLSMQDRRYSDRIRRSVSVDPELH